MEERDCLVALVTTPGADAESMAERIVESGLAACANIIPGVQSIYRWQGTVERAKEAMLILKTVGSALEPLNDLLREIHPYEVFELVALPISGGNPAYLNWIASSVSAGRQPD
ncbi:MAG: divalent cation tolerance protein CutA [Dehalococcoidia bacterium]|nr:divalent cation tolerance protein CutA [Dehalococcoidia bacterium]